MNLSGSMLTAIGSGTCEWPSRRRRGVRRLCSSLALGWALLSLPASALAQWTNQTITLRAGWNPVFLAIQPEPIECDLVFAGHTVESVWGWNRRFSTVQYIQDPNDLIPGQPDWLVWLPPAVRAGGVINLYTLQGQHAYLIKVPDGTPNQIVTLRGRPMVREQEWIADSFNLVGFHVEAGTAPTFQSYFAGSPAHAGRAIYRLNSTTGSWSPVVVSSERPNPGEAYWVQTVGESTFPGPIGVKVEQGRGLDYGDTLIEQTLRLKNNAPSARTFRVRAFGSAPPPATGGSALAGEVPLSTWRMSVSTDVGFYPLPARLTNTLAPGAEWAIRLAVRRPDMAPFPGVPGGPAGLYQSLLEVSDGAGVSRLIPVTARGLRSSSNQGGGFAPAGGELGLASPSDVDRTGLWIGSATLRKVNQPASLVDPMNPVPTASEFQFRLLVHVDALGRACLLQKVLLLWRNGIYTNNADGLGVLKDPGHYVLVTDETLATGFEGAAYRDGQPVARRLSSAAFGFRDPIRMGAVGPFGAGGANFGCHIQLDYDDPLNPFKHRYHPNHDNLSADFRQSLDEGSESFTVTRQIQLLFSASDPENRKDYGWGDNQVGGVYRETIAGLHQRPLVLEGIFRLHRAARVATLNNAPLTP